MTQVKYSSVAFQVEHVTIESGTNYDAVKTKLEASLPRFDNGIYVLLEYGEDARVLTELEKAPSYSIFTARPHGDLLVIAGQHRRAVQYEIGNALTASLMTREHLSASLYAPIRVLLRESIEGVTGIEYDLPSSVFGQFGLATIDKVAAQLDADLRAVFEAALS